MLRSSLVKSACVAIALSGFGASQAGAIEMVQGSDPAALMSEGMISKVVIVHRGATARGAPRRRLSSRRDLSAAIAAAPIAAGSIAAGSIAAEPIAAGSTAEDMAAGPGPAGITGARAARSPPARRSASSPPARPIAYAGQPPAPGLCWYYTDPSYRQGFWDACQ